MEASAATPRIVRFGIFELDAHSGELRRHGLKVRLPDQAFQILRLLVDRPGVVITRDELRQQLWTSDTFVDFDVGMNSAIRKLREALDDSAENPRFIETLPRRGYRFVASVQSAATAPMPEAIAATNATASVRFRLAWITGAAGLAVTVVTMAFVYGRGSSEGPRPGITAEQIRSIAVMPFENLTGDPEQGYFVDGITDALTTDLAQVAGLDVISRTSAMQYEGAKKPLPAIGQELNVDALLQGAVVRSGQRIRVTARLIHAATDRHVWAQSYDSDLSDVIALQQQIARAVAASVGLRGASPGRAGAPQAVDPRAYTAYLKGLAVGGRGSYDAHRTAVAYFEEAVAIQPDFAMAYAALAQHQFQFLFGGPLSPRESIPKAEAAVRKALQLDDTNPLAHRILANILHNFYWQWEEGDKELRRARELGANPGEFSLPRQALMRIGDFEVAIAEAERARKLDPLAFNSYMNVASAYRLAGQYDRAIAEFRRALEITPGHSRGYFQIGVTLLFMGRLKDAIGELETAVQASKGNLRFKAYLGYAYAAGGRPLDARKIAQELEARARQQYVSSFGIALIYDALGEKERALAALERAYQDRAVEFTQMTQYPPFKTIASEPRYQETMRLIGLPR
jgi:TolB-like protein/DNA-binding winged helix-turn-helix (wHTH) protein/tetratricopeptide (TPR) repeat protein